MKMNRTTIRAGITKAVEQIREDSSKTTEPLTEDQAKDMDLILESALVGFTEELTECDYKEFLDLAIGTLKNYKFLSWTTRRFTLTESQISTWSNNFTTRMQEFWKTTPKENEQKTRIEALKQSYQATPSVRVHISNEERKLNVEGVMGKVRLEAGVHQLKEEYRPYPIALLGTLNGSMTRKSNWVRAVNSVLQKQGDSLDYQAYRQFLIDVRTVLESIESEPGNIMAFFEQDMWKFWEASRRSREQQLNLGKIKKVTILDGVQETIDNLLLRVINPRSVEPIDHAAINNDMTVIKSAKVDILKLATKLLTAIPGDTLDTHAYKSFITELTTILTTTPLNNVLIHEGTSQSCPAQFAKYMNIFLNHVVQNTTEFERVIEKITFSVQGSMDKIEKALNGQCLLDFGKEFEGIAKIVTKDGALLIDPDGTVERLKKLHTRYQAYLTAEAQKISEAVHSCQTLLVPTANAHSTVRPS